MSRKTSICLNLHDEEKANGYYFPKRLFRKSPLDELGMTSGLTISVTLTIMRDKQFLR